MSQQVACVICSSTEDAHFLAGIYNIFSGSLNNFLTSWSVPSIMYGNYQITITAKKSANQIYKSIYHGLFLFPAGVEHSSMVLHKVVPIYNFFIFYI